MRPRKKKKEKVPHKLIMVICEGETEEAYIKILSRHYRLPVTIKTKVVGNAINARLVSQYMSESGVAMQDCKVFYVYDADVRPIMEKISRLPGTAIFSNPCIELWFLLHCKEIHGHISSDNVIKELCKSHPVWKRYGKGALDMDQSNLLISSRDIAGSHARLLNYPSNPSSNMGEFINYLESQKMLR